MSALYAIRWGLIVRGNDLPGFTLKLFHRSLYCKGINKKVSVRNSSYYFRLCPFLLFLSYEGLFQVLAIDVQEFSLFF